ncbi:hypothetical protein QJ48_02505 [Paenibacillus sp. A3]|uniref:hypothetical protein n=1 Tax=Paenibacillus sp. A3 TaxID=1337054 RepID=UPI0006D58C2E|nr:hypothetical protein [Paenibacillus sp. A3]KPV60962.1 hypothetical protein QJ48_02505 [Paenibacillus sp. A3]
MNDRHLHLPLGMKLCPVVVKHKKDHGLRGPWPDWINEPDANLLEVGIKLHLIRQTGKADEGTLLRMQLMKGIALVIIGTVIKLLILKHPHPTSFDNS